MKSVFRITKHIFSRYNLYNSIFLFNHLPGTLTNELKFKRDLDNYLINNAFLFYNIQEFINMKRIKETM